MQPIRRARLEAVILEELSKVVPRELKDPRISSITFTSCTVTPDGSQATVLVTLLGAHALQGGTDSDEDARAREKSEKKLQECIKGLASASGFVLASGVARISIFGLVARGRRTGVDHADRDRELTALRRGPREETARREADPGGQRPGVEAPGVGGRPAGRVELL